MVLTYKKILSQWIKETGYKMEEVVTCDKCKGNFYKSYIKEHQKGCKKDDDFDKTFWIWRENKPLLNKKKL
jgi:hypothetical protein